MQKRIEPPVLLSRTLVFVLASALVVLGVLFTTLYRMFPLQRPQIFFLTTEIRDDQVVQLESMTPNNENLDMYKTAFVREYIKYRNEFFSNPAKMLGKWNNESGIVRKTSSQDVYAKALNTKMINEVISGATDLNFECLVFFKHDPLYFAADDAYQVKFTYFCTDNTTGQATQKDYTIKLRIKDENNAQIKWAERIDNPLGLQVTEYTVIDGPGDPLDTAF